MAVPIREKCKLHMITISLTASLVISMLATIMIVTTMSGDNPYSGKLNTTQVKDVITDVQNTITENSTVIRVFHGILILISDLIMLVVVIVVNKNRTGSGHTIMAIILFLMMVLLLWRPNMFSSIVHIIIVISCFVFCFMARSDDNISKRSTEQHDRQVY